MPLILGETWRRIPVVICIAALAFFFFIVGIASWRCNTQPAHVHKSGIQLVHLSY